LIIETLMTSVPDLIDLRNHLTLGKGWDKVPLRRANGQLEIGLRPEGSIKRISVHHSGVEGDIFGHERYHVQTKGEPGVAYHTYLKRERRFLSNHPYALTWHTQSNNYDTLSVCIEGNFTKRNLTEVERNNLVTFLYDMMKIFNLSLDVVKGHWEWTSKSQTSCPGFDMNRIRDDIHALEASLAVSAQWNDRIAEVNRFNRQLQYLGGLIAKGEEDGSAKWALKGYEDIIGYAKKIGYYK
jgi:hypothetical protein